MNYADCCQVKTMRVYNFENGILKPQKTLLKALGFDNRIAVISVAGAGGKTSTILQMQKEYEEQLQPVIITTTTHMLIPKDDKVYGDECSEAFFKSLGEGKTVWAGNYCGDGKFQMPGREFLDQILKSQVPVLIEADGAKKRPVKVPAAWEPVIPKETQAVFYVFGMDAVGKPVKSVCHRAEKAARLLGKNIDDKLTCEDIAILAVHPEGGKKGVDTDMEYHVILNKTETENTMAYGKKIAGILEKESKISCHLTSYL